MRGETNRCQTTDKVKTAGNVFQQTETGRTADVQRAAESIFTTISLKRVQLGGFGVCISANPAAASLRVDRFRLDREARRGRDRQAWRGALRRFTEVVHRSVDTGGGGVSISSTLSDGLTGSGLKSLRRVQSSVLFWSSEVYSGLFTGCSAHARNIILTFW